MLSLFAVFRERLQVGRLKGVGATLIYLEWFCYNVSLLEQQQYTEQEPFGCEHKPVSEGACHARFRRVLVMDC